MQQVLGEYKDIFRNRCTTRASCGSWDSFWFQKCCEQTCLLFICAAATRINKTGRRPVEGKGWIRESTSSWGAPAVTGTARHYTGTASRHRILNLNSVTISCGQFTINMGICPTLVLRVYSNLIFWFSLASNFTVFFSKVQVFIFIAFDPAPNPLPRRARDESSDSDPCIVGSHLPLICGKWRGEQHGKWRSKDKQCSIN